MMLDIVEVRGHYVYRNLKPECVTHEWESREDGKGWKCKYCNGKRYWRMPHLIKINRGRKK